MYDSMTQAVLYLVVRHEYKEEFQKSWTLFEKEAGAAGPCLPEGRAGSQDAATGSNGQQACDNKLVVGVRGTRTKADTAKADGRKADDEHDDDDDATTPAKRKPEGSATKPKKKTRSLADDLTGTANKVKSRILAISTKVNGLAKTVQKDQLWAWANNDQNIGALLAKAKQVTEMSYDEQLGMLLQSDIEDRLWGPFGLRLG